MGRAATPRGKGARFPFGSTARPDLDRPRPWLTGVGCTGTGSTGTCTAEAVPNPPDRRGDHARSIDRAACSGRWYGGETPGCAEQDSGLRRTEQRSPPRRRRRWSGSPKRKNGCVGFCSRRLTRLSKPEGGSTLPSRRRVSSISECMLIANSLPAPARLRARVAHGTAGSGWSIRLF